MKILEHMFNHWDDDLDAVLKFIKEECSEDDIYEYMNIVVMVENLDASVMKKIWSLIEQ